MKSNKQENLIAAGSGVPVVFRKCGFPVQRVTLDQARLLSKRTHYQALAWTRTSFCVLLANVYSLKRRTALFRARAMRDVSFRRRIVGYLYLLALVPLPSEYLLLLLVDFLKLAVERCFLPLNQLVDLL